LFCVTGFGGNASLSGFSFPGANTATTTAAPTMTTASGGLSLGFNQSSLTATKPAGFKSLLTLTQTSQNAT